MAAYNLPGDYNQTIWDFTDPASPIPASGALIYTKVSGTNTDATTYQDAAGVATNRNPIVADLYGQFKMWLDPAIVYDIIWTLANGSGGSSQLAVTGAQAAGVGVTSVNGQTGVVALTADEIPYATTTTTAWFVGTNISAALDSIINYASAIPAAAVSVTDAGNYFVTPKNVENVLQQLGAVSKHGALLRITPFTSSGTWTMGTDVSFVVVEGVGGGGGSTTAVVGGGGGGAGGYFKRIVTTPGSTEVVTIGAGGAAGAPGVATSFGSWGIAYGGAGATGATAGGLGGTATGGTINLQGNGGGAGGNTSSNAIFGHGGGSCFGGGAPAQWNGGTPTAGAANTGGGGSGSTAGGASGGTGLVMVYEYS